MVEDKMESLDTIQIENKAKTKGLYGSTKNGSMSTPLNGGKKLQSRTMFLKRAGEIGIHMDVARPSIEKLNSETYNVFSKNKTK
jgi:hypothetical protein